MPDGRPRLLCAGSCRHGLLLRAAALREPGLFDSAFFMYWEDLDLCRCLNAAGHEIWCVPRAVIWHDVADGARALDSEYRRWC